jgi:single-stranded-DNA-specific exonuclease
MPPEKRWIIPPSLTDEAKQELQEYPYILQQLLFNRGYTTAAAALQFLEALTPAGTEPETMLGLPQAVDRLEYALDHSEPIAIYGDYDADGVTATALLVHFLRQLGTDVQGYIPNRFEEGYGLNLEALTSLKEQGTRLVITVDCGIRSNPEVDHARRIGLDLIITDHHHPLGAVPDALAVVNPKQPGDIYPDKNLAGVGLAYKLASGLLRRRQKENRLPTTFPPAETLLDLVALGTIADMAPLIGENRALVKAGLQLIRQPRRQGLAALIGVSGLTAQNINASDIGFVLGPRLNAAGRLDSALAAFDLLTSSDLYHSGELAQKLENQNRERQEITRQTLLRAEELSRTDQADQLLLFAADPDFNPGIVGLVASRLTEQYYRPAIVAHTGPDFTRASCRSIPEFHITDALDECADLMEHHGGHAAAAGFTVRNARLPELIQRLQENASRQLSALDLRPSLRADVELPLSDLKPGILELLERLQPTGSSNPPAIFVSRGLKISRSKVVGKDSSHLKLSVTDGKITYDAIGFRLGHWYEKLPPFIDLIYTYEKNEFNGNQTLQLNLKDLKPAQP